MLLACGALPHGTMYAPRAVAGVGGRPTPRVIMNPKCFVGQPPADAGLSATAADADAATATAAATDAERAARAAFVAALPASSTARRLYANPVSFLAGSGEGGQGVDKQLAAEFEWQVTTFERVLAEHLEEYGRAKVRTEQARVNQQPARGVVWEGALARTEPREDGECQALAIAVRSALVEGVSTGAQCLLSTCRAIRKRFGARAFERAKSRARASLSGRLLDGVWWSFVPLGGDHHPTSRHCRSPSFAHYHSSVQLISLLSRWFGPHPAPRVARASIVCPNDRAPLAPPAGAEAGLSDAPRAERSGVAQKPFLPQRERRGRLVSTGTRSRCRSRLGTTRRGGRVSVACHCVHSKFD